MKTTRRGFFRVLAGTTVLLTGAGCFGRDADPALHIHRATGNRTFGPVGDHARRPFGEPFKDYPDAESVKLDPVTELADIGVASASIAYRLPPGFSQASLGFADLGALLFYANGVTERRDDVSPPKLLRAAPSAGALYASELYVIARNVAELDRGVYYYDVRSHTLARVADAPSDGALADIFDLASPELHAPAYVAVSSVFDRYQWKYANRGYRYALVDTGHIGENLRLASTVLQVRERPLRAFADDSLNRALGLDGAREAVCAVHALGHSAEDSPEFAQRESLHEKGEARGLLGGLKGRATRRFQESTKLHRDGVAPPRPPQSIAVAPPALEEHKLPRAAQALHASLGVAIKQRRSPLEFQPTVISYAQLATLFISMRDRIGHDVTPYIIVHEVEGLARGLYRYEALRHRLSLLDGRDLRDAFALTCIGQEKARTAAVAVVMVGAVGAAMARDGRRAYRDVLVRAGELGQRVYLAAESMGLGARNLAAFRDDPLNELLGLDGEQLAVVHLTMFGQRA